MPASHPEESIPDSKNLKALRFVVLSLGIALAGGFVTVFAVIAKKLDTPTQPTTCQMVVPELPEYQRLRILKTTGQEATLLLQGDGLHHLIRLNMCDGTLLSHVKLRPYDALPIAAR